MSATGFNVDLRDMQFVLFEQLKVQERLAGFDKYAEFDQELYEATLQEAFRVTREVWWPVNGPGDRQGVSLDDQGNVTTPNGFKEAWDAQAEGGWVGFTAEPEWGGIGLPEPVGMAIGEMFTGSCPALSTYAGLSRGVANLLKVYGPEWIQQACIENLFTGVWGGTMCLTEAGAGSSVGDNRAKATPIEGEDGVYHLEGEKIFITGGDQDLTENIIHLVLARAPGAPNGTKGLSIFVVPKFDFEDGARNGAFVVGVEHKMGLSGSATCVLALGDRKPCRGYILGNEGDGMGIMFHMMNEARIAVGIQGLASAAAAYENALAYAKERVQGVALKDMRNPDAAPVTIVNHPDVRRMLMRMRVSVETMRSMLYGTAMRLVFSEHSADEDVRKMHHNHVELMTPICKAHCTDLGFEVCVTAVQTYGGYGYIQEYPVEQHVRDQKISSIYEGTNGIQAMDLLGRKMRKGSGALFMQWLQESGEQLSQAKESGHFADEIAQLEKAQQSLGAAAMHLGGVGAQGNLEGAMLQATPFMELFGTVILGLHALEQALIAQAALDAGASGSDERFYKGKVLNLKFYVSSFLPKAVALSKSIRSGDESCLDEALFQ
ncbi:MAG: acyl-CoA dehydrogenase [Alphaproteobacteria bacterium]|nr:acyl-CoA dehydrogenase [Alphaproteobacteria bacterium]